MSDLEHALDLLQNNQVVAIPTETVYGLAALASSENALKQIFKLKGRPSSNPLIVHIGDVAYLELFASSIPQAAYKLFQEFAPGPLTILLPKKTTVSPLITAQSNWVGLRIPNHPLTLELLRRLKHGVAAPSANKSNYISPTTALHVARDFTNPKLPFILDGGACQIGLESTILALHPTPTILRQGAISQDAISELLKTKVSFNDSTIKAPGQGKHYAPNTRLYLAPAAELPAIIKHAAVPSAFISIEPLALPPGQQWFALSKDPVEASQEFYALLRHIDSLNFKEIYISELPTTSPWQALNERLERALLV